MAETLYTSNHVIDFMIEIEERDIVVLQLTDTQIIDASQKRHADRLGSNLEAYWAKSKMEERCFSSLRKTIKAVKPDLIIITGDLVYGEFDDAGTSLLALIEFIENFHIPWAPVFGNHDGESRKGADWQCEQLENAENCLFMQRTLTGNGNYTVGIRQGGTLKRVFFMLDSNGSGAMSAETYANGHSSAICGFGKDQIDWYAQVASQIAEFAPEAKLSFAFHVQLQSFADAYAKYGFTNSNTITAPINIDQLENVTEGDFGYLGSDLKGAWDLEGSVWESLKRLGVDSVFVGHEHCNSASVVYDGIRCQYGQKSSTYDRVNYVQSDGTIVGSFTEAGDPMVGGTVIVLAKEDGSIKDAYHLLVQNDNRSR